MKKYLIICLLAATSANCFGYYNPAQGRWLSRDLLSDESFFRQYTAGMNRREVWKIRELALDPVYVYVQNDPVVGTDAQGLFKLSDLMPPGFAWGDIFPQISSHCIAAIGAIDIITTKIKGGGDSYNLQHCITSCKIRRVCDSAILNHWAGLWKELFDTLKPSPPFKDETWDSTDVEANKDGQACAEEKDKTCEDCCKCHGWTNE